MSITVLSTLNLPISIVILIVILIIGVVTYYYAIKLKQQQALYNQHLLEKLEAEKLRISLDLHDDIGQSLSIIKLKLGQIKNHDADLDNELNSVIEKTRTLSRNLYPSNLKKIGLKQSIAGLLETIQLTANIECNFEISNTVENLTDVVKMHVYRIIQECVHNTIKHSRASALKVSILEDNNTFTLKYQDNGIGIKDNTTNGHGLNLICERAKIINGKISFKNNSNKSFKLTLNFNG